MSSVDRLAERLTQANIMITVAESCTGGMLASALTAKAGASAYFDRGFVTYSNAAKTDLLSVPSAAIQQHGAVSDHVAELMAIGALNNSHAQIALSVTGIAGPNGGSVDKPVGRVYVAIAGQGFSPHVDKLTLKGDRYAIQKATVEHSLGLALRYMQDYCGEDSYGE